MTRIAMGFGSNLGDRAAHLAAGLRGLEAQGVRWRGVSSIYETAPVGPVVDQPPFLNQAAVGETNLDADALLQVCLDVERERGRLRDERWGPRTLDLDILLFGDREIDAPGLVVPHPRLRERAFVLVPLAEVARYWRVPGTGQSVDELLLRTTGREGVRVWRSSATRPPT